MPREQVGPLMTEASFDLLVRGTKLAPWTREACRIYLTEGPMNKGIAAAQANISIQTLNEALRKLRVKSLYIGATKELLFHAREAHVKELEAAIVRERERLETRDQHLYEAIPENWATGKPWRGDPGY